MCPKTLTRNSYSVQDGAPRHKHAYEHITRTCTQTAICFADESPGVYVEGVEESRAVVTGHGNQRVTGVDTSDRVPKSALSNQSDGGPRKCHLPHSAKPNCSTSLRRSNIRTREARARRSKGGAVFPAKHETPGTICKPLLHDPKPRPNRSATIIQQPRSSSQCQHHEHKHVAHRRAVFRHQQVAVGREAQFVGRASAHRPQERAVG